MLVLGAAVLWGCATKPPGTPASSASGPAWAPLSSTNQTVIVTPETVTAGKVVLVNPSARHVVLNFPPGEMPGTDQRLSLYRRGLKVGEVKIGGWQRENNIVADILAGEAQVGDEARTP